MTEAVKPCVLRELGSKIQAASKKVAGATEQAYNQTAQQTKQAYDTSVSVFNAFDTTSKVAMASTVGGGIISAASFITLLTNAVKNPTALKVLKGTGLAGLAVFALGSITSIAMGLVNKKAEMDKDKLQDNQISSLTADKAALTDKLAEQADAHAKEIKAKDDAHAAAIKGKDGEIAKGKAALDATLQNAGAIAKQQGIVATNTKALNGLLSKQDAAGKDVAAKQKAYDDAAKVVKGLVEKKKTASTDLTPVEKLANENAIKHFNIEMKTYNSEQELIKAWDNYNIWATQGMIVKPGTPAPQKPSQPDPRKAEGYVAKQKPAQPALIKPEAEKIQDEIDAANKTLAAKGKDLNAAKADKAGIDKQVTTVKNTINAANAEIKKLQTPAEKKEDKKPAKLDAAA